MENLNYLHLWYFWNVSEAGGVNAAARELGVSPATVSAAVRQLEASFGIELLGRSGREVVLTEAGERIRDRARGIFEAGRDLLDEVREGAARPRRLRVGVSDAVPKLVAHEFLRPVLEEENPPPFHVREGTAATLIGELLARRVDLVLTDEPVRLPPGTRLPVLMLGASSVTFFAVPSLAERLRPGFPRSLRDAPALLPDAGTALRRSLDRWFADHRVFPRTVGEFGDPALMKVFAREGHGFVPLPRVVSEEAIEENGFEVVGEARGCEERFIAITGDRGGSRPLVAAIIARARALLAERKA